MPPRFSGGARLAGDPAPEISAAEAKAHLLAAIDKVTAPILAAYPAAEPLSWLAKEAEATAILSGNDRTLAPLLVAECAAEQMIESDAVNDEQMNAKAMSVLGKATTWRAIVSRLSGLRQRAVGAIDAAENPASVQAALDIALAELASLGS